MSKFEYVLDQLHSVSRKKSSISSTTNELLRAHVLELNKDEAVLLVATALGMLISSLVPSEREIIYDILLQSRGIICCINPDQLFLPTIVYVCDDVTGIAPFINTKPISCSSAVTDVIIKDCMSVEQNPLLCGKAWVIFSLLSDNDVGEHINVITDFLLDNLGGSTPSCRLELIRNNKIQHEYPTVLAYLCYSVKTLILRFFEGGDPFTRETRQSVECLCFRLLSHCLEGAWAEVVTKDPQSSRMLSERVNFGLFLWDTILGFALGSHLRSPKISSSSKLFGVTSMFQFGDFPLRVGPAIRMLHSNLERFIECVDQINKQILNLYKYDAPETDLKKLMGFIGHSYSFLDLVDYEFAKDDSLTPLLLFFESWTYRIVLSLYLSHLQNTDLLTKALRSTIEVLDRFRLDTRLASLRKKREVCLIISRSMLSRVECDRLLGGQQTFTYEEMLQEMLQICSETQDGLNLRTCSTDQNAVLNWLVLNYLFLGHRPEIPRLEDFRLNQDLLRNCFKTFPDDDIFLSMQHDPDDPAGLGRIWKTFVCLAVISTSTSQYFREIDVADLCKCSGVNKEFLFVIFAQAIDWRMKNLELRRLAPLMKHIGMCKPQYVPSLIDDILQPWRKAFELWAIFVKLVFEQNFKNPIVILLLNRYCIMAIASLYNFYEIVKMTEIDKSSLNSFKEQFQQYFEEKYKLASRYISSNFLVSPTISSKQYFKELSKSITIFTENNNGLKDHFADLIIINLGNVWKRIVCPKKKNSWSILCEAISYLGTHLELHEAEQIFGKPLSINSKKFPCKFLGSCACRALYELYNINHQQTNVWHIVNLVANSYLPNNSKTELDQWPVLLPSEPSPIFSGPLHASLDVSLAPHTISKSKCSHLVEYNVQIALTVSNLTGAMLKELNFFVSIGNVTAVMHAKTLPAKQTARLYNTVLISTAPLTPLFVVTRVTFFSGENNADSQSQESVEKNLNYGGGADISNDELELSKLKSRKKKRFLFFCCGATRTKHKGTNDVPLKRKVFDREATTNMLTNLIHQEEQVYSANNLFTPDNNTGRSNRLFLNTHNDTDEEQHDDVENNDSHSEEDPDERIDIELTSDTFCLPLSQFISPAQIFDPCYESSSCCQQHCDFSDAFFSTKYEYETPMCVDAKSLRTFTMVAGSDDQYIWLGMVPPSAGYVQVSIKKYKKISLKNNFKGITDTPRYCGLLILWATSSFLLKQLRSFPELSRAV